VVIREEWAGWRDVKFTTDERSRTMIRARRWERKSTGGIAYATQGKFVSNRKLFLLCFHWEANEDGDFVRFICIE
jgi:hypothetical protein